jgi:GNAT superfamily N-acetyltransferase
MFVDTTIAARVERAEAQVTRAMAGALTGSPSAPEAIVIPVGPGVAAFARQGSPINKVIGVGLDAPIDDATLDGVERVFDERHEPVRVELSTLAVPASGQQLTARGYRLLGFENVLARRLAGVEAPRAGGVRVARIVPGQELLWKDVVVDAAAASDETGVPPDDYSREVVDVVMRDSLAARGFARYLASLDGVIAGGGSMYVHDGVAILTGSATLPQHRRRGVQAALIAHRLHDAHAAGAELAIITTAPGTQSQANVMKLGFALVYARAILVRG